MKPQYFLTTIFLFTSIIVTAQTTTKIDEQPYIEVVGTADMEIIPDEIYIGIILKEKYVNKVKITIEAQEEKLKTTLASINVDLTNLYLSDANAGFVRIPWRKKDVLTKKDYTLKVSDAETVGKVFQELEKLEIIDAFIQKVDHSEIDSLRKEVKILAIKAGKDKADYLLRAIGEETGKALIVTENSPKTSTLNSVAYSATNYEFESRLQRELAADKLADFSSSDIQFEKIKLSSSIYLKFSIK